MHYSIVSCELRNTDETSFCMIIIRCRLFIFLSINYNALHDRIIISLELCTYNIKYFILLLEYEGNVQSVKYTLRHIKEMAAGYSVLSTVMMWFRAKC